MRKGRKKKGKKKKGKKKDRTHLQICYVRAYRQVSYHSDFVTGVAGR